MLQTKNTPGLETILSERALEGNYAPSSNHEYTGLKGVSDEPEMPPTDGEMEFLSDDVVNLLDQDLDKNTFIDILNYQLNERR